MTADQLRSLLRAIVYITVVAVPVLFWRGITNAFDLTKATLLVTLALGALATLIWLAIMEPRRIAPRSILITSGLFVVALIIATITSIDPIGSIIGQRARFTGIPVVIGCLVVMVSIIAAFGPRTLIVLGRLITPVVAVIGVYAFVQHVDIDPFLWGTESFGGQAFSTVGNPNTAAGVTAIALPFVLWLLLDPRVAQWMRWGAGAVAGLSVGALVAFESFQGPVAALISVLYLLAWALANGRTLGVWLIAIAAAVPLAVLPVLPRRVATVAFVVFVLYYLVLVLLLPTLERLRAPAALVAKRWWVVGGVGLIAVLAAVLFGPSITAVVADELADGLNERTAFYRAAIDSFADTPLTGDGFETFGITFTEYRPEWHAVRLEGSRTSSVHSIWLAMFQSGGVLLGGTFVVLMATVLIWLGRGVRREPLASGGVLLAAGGAFVASLVQGLVSVEHVALYLLQFTAAGMIVAAALGAVPAPEPEPSTKSGRTPPVSKRRRHAAQRRVPTAAVVASLVVAMVIAGVVVVRPMRAELAERRANEAINADLVAPTLEELATAISLAPWAAGHRALRAAVYNAIGDTDAAAVDAAEILVRSSGSIHALPVVQYLIGNANDRIARSDPATAQAQLLQARTWVLTLQANDPKAPLATNEAAGYLIEIATALHSIGDIEGAQAARADAVRLDPNIEIPDILQQ